MLPLADILIDDRYSQQQTVAGASPADTAGFSIV
jgi:hypothetical protein